VCKVRQVTYRVIWEAFACQVGCTHVNKIRLQYSSHMAFGICVLYVARIWHQCGYDICESHMAALHFGVAKVKWGACENSI
jgi:hypothetical protein